MIEIGFSGHNLCRPMTGVGRYLQSLSRIQSPLINKVAFVPNHNIQIEHGFDKLIFSDNNTKLGKLFWSYNHMLLSNLKYDVYHSPQMFLPFFRDKKVKKIVTIHDLLFLDMPYLYSNFEKAILKISLMDAISRADHIVCISKYTYSCFKKHFPNKKNVQVIYNCIPLERDNGLDNQVEFQNYFILPSNRTPRKNIKKTIIAYKKSLFYKNGFKLLICGPSDGQLDVEYDNLIHDVGYLTEVELKKLYKNSCGLLFFSLGEGFGYPIVEAAIYGIPVLASANSSILELFDNQTHLLCSEYNSVSGIHAFLDKYYHSKDMKFNILEALNKCLANFTVETFNEQLLTLYNH